MSRTKVNLWDEDFTINGILTYPNKEYKGHRVEGLLMNARMIQAIFDDLNPETRRMWDYPDGPWDPDRNTNAFIAMLPEWKEAGLLGFTVGLQGGSPQGYSKEQPWENSTFAPDGALREAYLDRLKRVLDRADALRLVPIVSYFYFGQDERLKDEAAVIRATDRITDWIVEQGYTNVLIEIANETNVPKYEHEILCPGRIAELIERVQERTRGKLATEARRLLAGTSYGGGGIPNDQTNEASDVILLHGNGQDEPDKIRDMVKTVRGQSSYRGQPIVFNEDDHFDFEKADNNMLAAISQHASWGLFDYRMRQNNEGYEQGYQSVPVDWGSHSGRKKSFYAYLREVTTSEAD